jgi:site-specific recombinase XerD
LPPKSPFVFVSERGGPFTTDSFNWMVKRAGQKADLPLQVHAHMLRHAAGYKLAGDGHDTRSIQDYLGHKNIQHTVRYEARAAERSAKSSREDIARAQSFIIDFISGVLVEDDTCMNNPLSLRPD